MNFILEALAQALAALISVAIRLWTGFASLITCNHVCSRPPTHVGTHAVKMGRHLLRHRSPFCETTASGVRDVLYPTAQFTALERKNTVSLSRILLLHRMSSRTSSAVYVSVKNSERKRILDERDALPPIRKAARSTALPVPPAPRKRKLDPLEPLPSFLKRCGSRRDDDIQKTKETVEKMEQPAEEVVALEKDAANEIEKDVQVRSPPPSVDNRPSPSPVLLNLPPTPPPSSSPHLSSTVAFSPLPPSFPVYLSRPAPGPTRIPRWCMSPLSPYPVPSLVRRHSTEILRAVDMKTEPNRVAKSTPMKLDVEHEFHPPKCRAPLSQHTSPLRSPLSPANLLSSVCSAAPPSARASPLATAESLRESADEDVTVPDHLALHSPSISSQEKPASETFDKPSTSGNRNSSSPLSSPSQLPPPSPMPMVSSGRTMSPLPPRSPSPTPSFILPPLPQTPMHSPARANTTTPVRPSPTAASLPALNPPTPPMERLERRIQHELDKIDEDWLRILRSRGTMHNDVLDHQNKLKRQRNGLRDMIKSLTHHNVHIKKLKAEKVGFF